MVVAVKPLTGLAWLWKLDPSQYENSVNELISGAGLTEHYGAGSDNPFAMLLEKILAIGSYGIRYRKRVYAGYADERKVTGRKEKESERGTFFYANWQM